MSISSGLKQGTKDVLMDLDIMDGMMFNGHVSGRDYGNSAKMRSYLSGALWPRSVNNPETSRYHLEIFSFMNSITKTFGDMLN